MLYVWLAIRYSLHLNMTVSLIWEIPFKSNHKAPDWVLDLRHKLEAVWFCGPFPMFLICAKNKLHSDERPLNFTSKNVSLSYLIFFILLSWHSCSLGQIAATGLPVLSIHSHASSPVVKEHSLKMAISFF